MIRLLCLNFRSRSHVFPLLLLISGCVPSTTFKSADHCRAYLTSGDRILLSSLPYDNWEFQLADIRKQLAVRKATVLYAPEEEFSLRAAGIINPIDSTNFPLLAKKGITHLLTIRELSSRDGSMIDHKTSFEVAREHNASRSVATNDGTLSAVEFEVILVSLRQNYRYRFDVKTNVSGSEVRSDNGGRTSVNMGGITKARNIAIRKAMKKIAEECR